jgi:hypothetical protein
MWSCKSGAPAQVVLLQNWWYSGCGAVTVVLLHKQYYRTVGATVDVGNSCGASVQVMLLYRCYGNCAATVE